MSVEEQLQFWLERLNRPEFVYFIEAQGAGLVKIGWSRDPVERRLVLQRASDHPLVLRYVLPGGWHAEGRVHDRFMDLCEWGEWFGPPPLILAWAEAVSHRMIETYPTGAGGRAPRVPEPEDWQVVLEPPRSPRRVHLDKHTFRLGRDKRPT